MGDVSTIRALSENSYRIPTCAKILCQAHHVRLSDFGSEYANAQTPRYMVDHERSRPIDHDRLPVRVCSAQTQLNGRHEGKQILRPENLRHFRPFIEVDDVSPISIVVRNVPEYKCRILCMRLLESRSAHL